MTAHASSGSQDGRGGEDEHRAAPPRGGGRLPLGWTIAFMAVAAGALYFALPRLRTVRSWDASGEPSP